MIDGEELFYRGHQGFPSLAWWAWYSVIVRPAVTLAHLLSQVPIWLHIDEKRQAVGWFPTGESQPDGRSFGDWIVSLRSANPHLEVTLTGCDALDKLSRAPLPDPAGFIFHMSRSGSTALARALATVPNNRMIAEPEPLNQLLAGPAQRLDNYRSGWLRGLILALAAGGGSPAQRAVLKLSSWNVLYQPLLLETFPTTPWIFLYRRPEEVMVSLLRSQPAWLREPQHVLPNGMEPFLPQPATEEVAARMLDLFCRSAVAHFGERALFIDHRDLWSTGLARACRHFGLSMQPEDERKMTATARLYSKNPSQRYLDDSAWKKHSAEGVVSAAARRWCSESFAILQATADGQPDPG